MQRDPPKDNYDDEHFDTQLDQVWRGYETHIVLDIDVCSSSDKLLQWSMIIVNSGFNDSSVSILLRIIFPSLTISCR